MKRIIAMTILVLYSLFLIATPVYVAITMSHAASETSHHQHHENGHDCPFMMHEETLCDMTVLDHLSLIRNWFEALLPSILILTIVAIAAVVKIPHVLANDYVLQTLIRTHVRWRQKLLTKYEYRSLSTLFARGILHGKPFSQ
jgi:hypothetical protein